MSQFDPAAEQAAARAVVNHHAQLATALAAHTARILQAADDGDGPRIRRHQTDLVSWLRDELLPHARAEEAAMYPVAARLPEGRLLVDGMLDEHRTITGLVAEIERATTPVTVAAAARALDAVFAGHLVKENELIVPLLVDAADVSLSALLDGMHDLIGASSPAAEGGGGCGGDCGCGGDAAPTTAEPPVLSIDPRLDVRDVPHAQRHQRVLAALDALPPHGALVLIAPHAPRPLLAEIDNRYAGQVSTEWLQSGPDVWQIRLQRAPAPA